MTNRQYRLRYDNRTQLESALQLEGRQVRSIIRVELADVVGGSGMPLMYHGYDQPHGIVMAHTLGESHKAEIDLNKQVLTVYEN